MTTATTENKQQTTQPKSVANNNSGAGIAAPAVPVLQQKETEEPEHEHLVQKKEAHQFASKNDSNESSGITQLKNNNTGMPDNLKSGVENLSGMDMSDVKVHYNSAQPDQLNAHAYAQGNDIHLGPGQEQHLPHEAWHVVQQRQGRVQATKQMKGGINVNDDPGLEHEADVMGEKALTVQRYYIGGSNTLSHSTLSNNSSYSGTLQRVKISDEFSPSKMMGWVAGQATRGIASVGGKAVMNNLILPKINSMIQPLIQKLVDSLTSMAAQLLGSVAVPVVGQIYAALNIIGQVADALEGIFSHWKNLANEARVFIKYLVASIHGWVFGYPTIPSFLIGEGKLKEKDFEFVISSLKTISQVTPTKIVSNAASYVSTMVSGAATATMSAVSGMATTAAGSVAGWLEYWGVIKQSTKEGFVSGIKDETPPVPIGAEEIKRVLSDAKAKLSGEKEAEDQEETDKEPADKEPVAEEKPVDLKTPLRAIDLGPLKLYLYELRTEGATKDSIGGLVAIAGGQLKLFGYEFPKNPIDSQLKITIPWFGHDFSVGKYFLGSMNSISINGSTFDLAQDPSDKVTVALLNPVTVTDLGKSGFVHIDSITFSNLSANDEGLKSVSVKVLNFKIYDGMLNAPELAADWKKDSGSTFTGGLQFSLGGQPYASASATISYDKEGHFSNATLGNGMVKLPTPFKDFTIESGSTNKDGETTIMNAAVTFDDGYGISEAKVDSLKIHKDGTYEFVAGAKFGGMNFFDDQLKFNETSIKVTVTKAGWKVDGQTKLVAGKEGQDPRASGDVFISYDNAKKEIDFSIEAGEVHATLFKTLQVDGTGIKYKDKVLTISKGKIEIQSELLKSPKADIEGLRVDKDGVDWEKATLTVNAFKLWETVQFSSTNATVYGKKKGYETHVAGGLNVNLGEGDNVFGLGGEGEVIYKPDKPTGENLSLNHARVGVNGKVEMPGAMMPGWPLHFNVSFPILPGLEATGYLDLSGGLKLSLDGEVVTHTGEPTWKLTANGGGDVNVKIELGAGIVAGSTYVVGISANVFAALEAKAGVTMNMEGVFTKLTELLDNSQISYSLGAKLVASFGANVQGHAFGIFHKKLYEIKLAEFEFGKYERSGTTSFNKNGSPKPSSIDGKIGFTPRDKELDHTVNGNEQEVERLLLDASQSILDTENGAKRKEILNKLTRNVAHEASCLLEMQQSLKGDFNKHMKDLMNIIVRKDMYFQQHFDEAGIQQKLDQFDAKFKIKEKQNIIRNEGFQLDQVEAQLKKILATMNDVESAINSKNLERSAGDIHAKADKSEELNSLKLDLLSDRNISLGDAEKGLDQLQAEKIALTDEVSQSVMSPSVFLTMSTTMEKEFVLFGEQKETVRKNIEPVDTALKEYDKVRGSSPEDQKEKLDILNKAIETYLGLWRRSSRTQQVLILKFQVEDALAQLKKKIPSKRT